MDVHLFETDAYDREAREAALAGPAVEALCEKGGRLLPHMRALVEDLFALYFKLHLRKREVPLSAALNRRIVEAAADAEGVDELRSFCALDAVRAAAAALSVANAALHEIRKGEVLTEEELLDGIALRKAEERIAELQRLREAVRQEGGDHAIRARIDRELEKVQRFADETGARVERTLEELPSRLEAEVAHAAAGLGERLEADEETARAFAEGIGASAPAQVADRVELAEKLRGNEKLRKLALLAGAFRRDAMAARKRRVRRASSEIHRVSRGADVSRLLPSELAGYVDVKRRLDFLRRFAEADLAQYELQGSDRGGRGPIVVCVDASSSMSGPRELWSKAVTLALLEIARRQNRRAEAIVFSGRESELHRFELVSSHSRGGRQQAAFSQLIEFAGCFPGGGTDFEKPLSAALDRLEDARLRGGDIVFVTDGEAPISARFAAELADARRKLDFSVYGVLIDDPSVGSRRAATGAVRPEIERAARELRKVADKITTVTRLTSGSVRGLFERL